MRNQRGWIVVWVLAVLAVEGRGEEDSPAVMRRLVVAEDGEGVLWSIAFAPDGKTIACGGSLRRVHLFDVATGELLRSFGNHPDNVWAVAWSPDGKVLCSGGRSDLVLRAWDPQRGEERPSFEGHRGGITRIRFFRDGKRLIMAGGSWDPTVRVWDVPNRAMLIAMTGHTDLIDAMDLSPDGRLAITGSRDGTLRLWSLERGREYYQQRATGDDDVGYLSAVFAPDGRSFAFGTSDGRFEVRETVTRRRCLPVSERNGSVRAIAFSPDGRLVAFTSDTRLVQLWDTRTGARVTTFDGHRAQIHGLDFSPDGKLLASCASDSTAIVWRVPAVGSLARRLTDQERAQAVANLGSENPVAARHAMNALGHDLAPLPASMLDRLQPAAGGDDVAIRRWIGQLAGPKFAERERAERALERAGDQARAALAHAWTPQASAEQRRRLERLLDRLDTQPVSGDMLWQLRTIAVLETRGGAVAKRRLTALADGAPGSRVTREARDALARLSAAAP